MEGITVEEMLLHYEAKLGEAAEEIQSLRNYLKRAMLELDDIWTGQAACVYRAKLEETDNEMKRADGEISEAMLKLSAVGELLAENDI